MIRTVLSVAFGTGIFAIATTSILGTQGPNQDPLTPPLGLEVDKIPLAASTDALTADKVELGKKLFFDERLSGTGKMSCSTCHLHELGWTDGKKLSPKFDGNPNTRNTPTVYNVGYLEKLYWDGRAAGLEKNIVAAWKNQMGGKPEEVAKALAAIPAYAKEFEKAYKAAPAEDTITKALAAFLRTLRSGNSPYDRFMSGKKDALDAKQKAGFDLFMGAAGCIVCHPPPLFTDRLFHITGVGLEGEKPDPGAGGEKALNDKALVGAFKTPTLRGVAKTAPYFHDGGVADLKEAVKIMVGGGKAHARKDVLLQDRKLSDEQIDQLVAFLGALTSDEKFTKPELPK